MGRSWRGTIVSATTNPESASTTNEQLKEINATENKSNENNNKIDVSNSGKNENNFNEKREPSQQRGNQRTRRIHGRNQNTQVFYF